MVFLPRGLPDEVACCLDLGRHVDELRDAASVVANHHERWDGRGYPGGLAVHRIPVEARIIAVADSLVSMTAERPNRPAMSVPGALTDLWRRSGRSYDPAVVSA
ncbi:MAG: HD-GYP domain-containing protein, partial [Gaiellaceae bacterium]